MNTPNKIYAPVTIITEDELGRVGTEDWPQLTMEMIIARCRWLSDEGWEPVEIQIDEAQSALDTQWWVDKPRGES